MLAQNPLPRSPATALCLCALLLAASLPAFAQTPWDAQDQTDMWRRLQAQGMVRPPESARTEAATQGEPSAMARFHEAGRDGATGADPRRRSGQGRPLRTPLAPEARALPHAGATTDVETPSTPAQPCT